MTDKIEHKNVADDEEESMDVNNPVTEHTTDHMTEHSVASATHNKVYNAEEICGSHNNTVSTDSQLIEHTDRQKNKDLSHLVQIKASNGEIARRITALIEQKQNEVDEINRQEFCNVHPSLEACVFVDTDETCARARSVFIPRAGGKSHIKVSRVINMYGPQTRALGTTNDMSPYKRQIKQEVTSFDGMEERISNMENHLKLKGPQSKVDIYSRLKSLEERILFLESISPEYFTTGPPPVKKQRTDTRYAESSSSSADKEMNLSEIDDRIRNLRESLLKKSLAG